MSIQFDLRVFCFITEGGHYERHIVVYQVLRASFSLVEVQDLHESPSLTLTAYLVPCIIQYHDYISIQAQCIFL